MTSLKGTMLFTEICFTCVLKLLSQSNRVWKKKNKKTFQKKNRYNNYFCRPEKARGISRVDKQCESAIFNFHSHSSTFNVIRIRRYCTIMKFSSTTASMAWKRWSSGSLSKTSLRERIQGCLLSDYSVVDTDVTPWLAVVRYRCVARNVCT